MTRVLAIAVAWAMACAIPCGAQWIPDQANRPSRAAASLHSGLGSARGWGPFEGSLPAVAGWDRSADPGSSRVAFAQMPPDRWLAPDKLKHFFLSFGVTGFTYAGARAVGAGERADWFAPTAAMAAGIGKELSDLRHGWGFSLRDLVWDAAGVMAAMIAMRQTG